MLVAELDGRVVGTVSMGGHGFQRPGSLRLFALDVGPDFRRGGVGTALVRAVEAIASGRGLDEVNLEVAIDNEDAIRLYERLGYRRHGEPVMDRWEKRLDDGSSLLVEVPSWVMVKRLGRVQAAIAAPTGRPARSLPRRHGQTTAAARPSSQPERGTSLRAVDASTWHTCEAALNGVPKRRGAIMAVPVSRGSVGIGRRA